MKYKILFFFLLISSVVFSQNEKLDKTKTENIQKVIKLFQTKNYFLNAKALNAWMRKTFGVYPTNPKHKNFTKSQGGVNGQNFPNLFKNKKGIYSLVSPTNSQWASGHADILYLNGTCKAGCHFFDGDILYIDFWELN